MRRRDRRKRKKLSKKGFKEQIVPQTQSIKKESFENNTLDYPHYVGPQDFRGLKVPDVLLSGNHAQIQCWRKDEALKITKKRRPDLLEKGR